MNRVTRPAACIGAGAALAMLIAGCGKSDAPAPGISAKQTTAASDQGVSAEVVAKQARGELSCPANITSPARADSVPVDDVLGVRQGFSARFAEPRVVKTGKQIVQERTLEAMERGGNAVHEDLKPGQVKWFVGSMGLPGQERVLSVAREECFAADQSPTIDSVIAALLKKYGTATRTQRGASGYLPLVRWAYDPLGRRVDDASPLYNKCGGASDPNGGVHLSPDCGVVVQATLFPHKSNPELVERMHVGVVNQLGGYQAITATEQALGQRDQQRRTNEVAKAAKDAKAPSL